MLRDHPEVSLLRGNFCFTGQGQRDTPVAWTKGHFLNHSVAKRQKASKFRDRALQAHMTDLKAAKGASTDHSAGIPRLKSKDSTKELGSVIKQVGAAPEYYGLLNGGVNTAVMPTKTKRKVQVILRPKEAAREAFTDSMRGWGDPAQ